MIRPLRGDGDLLAFEEGGMPSPRQVLILDFRMINLNTAKATSTETRERLRCGPSSSRHQGNLNPSQVGRGRFCGIEVDHSEIEDQDLAW